MKIDFTNAFNSLHRRDMLSAIRDRLPELYPFLFSAYASPSILHYGSYTIFSNEGPQQGNPLGSLLFSSTIHPLLLSLQSEITVRYLDDLTLAGGQDIVTEDVQRIVGAGSELGIFLNVSKCELIANTDVVVDDQ